MLTSSRKKIVKVVKNYTKEKAKKILLKASPRFCKPLSREETRRLNFLEPIFKTNSFKLDYLTINGNKKRPPIEIFYPDSILFRATNSETQNFQILPSGGICTDKKILCTGVQGKQEYNILGYLKSFVTQKKVISGIVICIWSQQFLSYGDFVLQLLPELCLIKSIISQEEWSNAHFIFSKPRKFVVDYLRNLGVNESQIIDSSNYCFDVAPKSQIYFREKDPLRFFCAPLELLQISRKYLMNEQGINHNKRKILFVERLGGIRRAIGLNEQIRSNLRELGVSFFNPANVSVKKQIETFANARIVVGIHGAGIANILWCQQGTKVVEIFHPKFAHVCYPILANHLNMDYYCLGGNPGNRYSDFRESDVDVDWDGLFELIKYLKK